MKNLRVLSSLTRNPKRRKQVLFLLSTSSAAMISEIMKLSSMKMFPSSQSPLSSFHVSSLWSNHLTRTEGKLICVSRLSNQQLLLLVLSSLKYPNDKIHLKNVYNAVAVVKIPSLASILDHIGLNNLLLLLDIELHLLLCGCFYAQARPPRWAPLQFLHITRIPRMTCGLTLNPSILGATWLFFQVKAPAKLSAAIARGCFCWLERISKTF